MDNNKEIYLNNIEILASALLKAIEECNNDKTSSSMKYVYAYLFGAIGVISSFFEYAKSIDKSIEEDNIFKAIQYAFDLLKHNPRIATLANRKAGQGISFPFGGSFAFTKTEIIG